MEKPHLSKAEIWNMSVGFMGIQFGFALQNSNASRILQSFGADVHQLSWFWIVAPLTGMIIQPIIGYYSDKSWTRLGRRKPFFLAGALAAGIGLILMPNAGLFAAILPALWVGAGMLMIMDASFNVAMEPFRALVGDKLPSAQRTDGFAAQTVLIGIGAVVGSWLPYVLAEWVGISKVAADNGIPDNLIYSFVIGAIVLITTILWTIFKTKEYSPEEIKNFSDTEEEEHTGRIFIVQLFKDIWQMPKTMKQLAWVQFFSWFALFGMWVYATPAVAQHIYGLAKDDTHSTAYNDAGNWVGIIFGVYNLVSAIYAFFLLPKLASKFGRKNTHMISLVAGGFGLISFYFAPDKNFLILSMVGVGMAWASILAMPYAILAGSLPARKMGVYMGIFNLFITIPQIINAIIGGPMVKYMYGDHAVITLVVSGCCFFLAALATLFVEDKDEVVIQKI
ncbi:MAG: MFS transporter [Saprospiraceae bacterium]|nr:MFS transporter [Saprospiraceae bacterium]